MTDHAQTTDISIDDPRYGYAMVTSAMHDVIAGSLDQLDAPTPCDDFNVKQLLNHILMVQQRVSAVGDPNRHWSDVQDPGLDEGWGDAFREASHAVRRAWDDPARLEAMVEVPWGEFPGGAVLTMYIGELAVHGWDLAHATGQVLAIDDEYLREAYEAAMFVPAEGRDAPEMPFGPVVDVREDAPLLDKIAGWWGRQVS